MKATCTSIAAYRTAPIIPLRDRVEAVIKSFGPNGCITDDVIGHFSKTDKTNTGKITGRFSELIDEGKIVRLGDKRKGVSGKQQLVMRHTDFVPKHLIPSPSSKSKKNPFFEGLKRAAIVIVGADPMFKNSAGAKALRKEMEKIARRAS